MAPKPSISRDDVLKVATLARVQLDDDEVQAMAADLTDIIGYVQTLEQLDTSGIEPTTHAIDLPTALRDDEVRPGLPVETGLRAAPERIGDGFGVPKIIE